METRSKSHAPKRGRRSQPRSSRVGLWEQGLDKQPWVALCVWKLRRAAFHRKSRVATLWRKRWHTTIHRHAAIFRQRRREAIDITSQEFVR
jgi:hypothetical protein